VRKEEEDAWWAKWTEQASCAAWLAGLKSEENCFSEIFFGFLNIPRLWKFVQEDLGGILMWGFFLNSSRPLNDFRKNIIHHAMQCILCKIIFGWIFLYARQFNM
jgi:hypothetical protein